MSHRFDVTQNIWEDLYKGGHKLSYPNDVFVRITHRLLDSSIHPRVLDYGCGSGENLLHLARREFQMTGADISDSALETTRLRLQEADLNAELSLINGATLPFEDASFDVIVAWQVLTYNDWNSLPVILAELDRVLCPGGIFIATMSAPGDFMEQNGKPLHNGLYELQSRGQEGALIMIVQEAQLPDCFPGKAIKTGWFAHEFDGIPSHHWIISYEK
ncbi:MAG: class I SAM-dependent methyltransferase [Gammaproteobacteria bacterium]|nr:class I SAM-dependent methyltransferase [Gammaproteobacteria bacterium]MCF6261489.1 class I SAM-dependent methyltransferase [Gammaproteobacteria bacterium]